ncbi:MAG: hypothetical protein HUK22_08370, partial [Thermoguttaceae bacterium]|nr:hypothetical protein [Thermoguttaceae bacterium]
MQSDAFPKIGQMMKRDTRNNGDVLSYLTNDVDVIGMTLNMSLSTIISSAVTMLGVIIILFILEWKIALIAVILIPVILNILTKISGASEKHFKKRSDITASVSSSAEESYTAFNILRVFNASKRNCDKFAEKNYELEKEMAQADYYAGISTPLISFFGNLMF